MENSKTISETERLENKQMVIDEMRHAYERKYSASDVLDGKLQNMFSFLSIVVSVALILEVMINPSPGKINLLFVGMLIVVLALYYWAFVMISATVAPMYYKQQISTEWDTLVEKYFDATKEQVFNRIISDYLYSLKDIGKKNDEKIETLKKVSYLMAFIVIILLVAGLVNILTPSKFLL